MCQSCISLEILGSLSTALSVRVALRWHSVIFLIIDARVLLELDLAIWSLERLPVAYTA